jgi:hypothetical protein
VQFKELESDDSDSDSDTAEDHPDLSAEDDD